MKYFIIEIQKPVKDVKGYKMSFQEKISNSEFEVVKVCSSQENAQKELIPFIYKNIRNQSGLHYEIIEGDNSEGFNGLKEKIENYYKRIK